MNFFTCSIHLNYDSLGNLSQKVLTAKRVGIEGQPHESMDETAFCGLGLENGMIPHQRTVLPK